MAKYLLIETKGPLDGGDYAFEVGEQLRDLGHDVTIYLLQDGVFIGRNDFAAAERLRRAAEEHDLQLLADIISLRQRGVVGSRVAAMVRPGDMDELLELMMEGTDKVIWH